MTPVPTVFTSGDATVSEFSFVVREEVEAYGASSDVIPVPVRVPLTTRGPVIVVFVALTSKTFVKHVVVSPFREISFLAVKVAKVQIILDP